MEKSTMERYAALLIDACLGLKAGDRLRIAGEPCARPFMHVLAETAYRRGARQVRLEYPDPSLERIFVDNVREEWVEDISALVKREADCLVEEGWSYLRLTGEERPGVLEGADTDRLQRFSRVRSLARKNLMEAQMSSRLIWCVAPLPTAAWGRQVFEDAGRDAPADPEAALLAELLPILRLDAPDTGAIVLSHAREIEARCKRLDALSLSALRFSGPGTELRVGLSRRSRWVGGGSRTPDGRYFLANHPSEEAFTSPDARLTEGRATCTRPVEVLGAKVEGAWFEFRGGVVVDFGAAKNRGSLERYFQIEPNARRLGEVALVDGSGPIFRSGLVFNDALIDENAACHIALGAAYEEAFEGSEGMDEEAKRGEGFNTSLVHTDFMIGSGQVEVTGIDGGGRERPLIHDGSFAI
jgi:aminopeptidase